MSYCHLTPEERGQIQALFYEGKTNCYIAKKLCRSATTVWRELNRNSFRGRYEAQRAQKLYKNRRKDCRPSKKLSHPALWRYVIEKIPEENTPKLIACRLRLDYPDDPQMHISHETLYREIYTDKRLHFLIEYLPQSRPKRRKRGQGKSRRGPCIPNRVGIEKRPEIVQQRARFGDWEADTIVGANKKGYIVSLVERKSRLLVSRKVSSKKADVVAKAIVEALEKMPASWVKTITFDNGTEFALHEKIAKELCVNTYFATPYSAWQRGTNENTNGLIRRYLPKGTDFSKLTQAQLEIITQELNNRPRKVLEYRTANEVFQKQRNERIIALSS